MRKLYREKPMDFKNRFPEIHLATISRSQHVITGCIVLLFVLRYVCVYLGKRVMGMEKAIFPRRLMLAKLFCCP